MPSNTVAWDDPYNDVVRLFTREVPELAAGTIEIKAIARVVGSRTKIAVKSYDRFVDAVGACVGPRGVRVRNVVTELGGENIDIISWSEDPEVLIAESLCPAIIKRIILNPGEHRAVAYIGPEQVGLALGRNGENRNLASALSGWEIEIAINKAPI